MKRTYSKLAAQPEHLKVRPRPQEQDQRRLSTADRVRLSLLATPSRRG